MNGHENRTLQPTNCIPSANENVSCYQTRTEKYVWLARPRAYVRTYVRTDVVFLKRKYNNDVNTCFYVNKLVEC